MSVSRLFLCAAFAIALIGCATETHDRQRSMATIEPDKVSIPEYQNFLASLSAALDEGRPRELNTVEQARFDDVMGRLDRMLDRFESVDDMNQDERVALLNLHADLEEVVMGAADQQVICQRRHTVGSNFKRTTCKTRAEWRSDRENASRLMRDIYISSMTAPPGS
ncbi:MAG: hypothetical protein V2J10_09135 [Wenzhouxiangella sp.]|jgi:hypothetical protein|nr:hypothetical protein [Wenzhouxiangella sp.]